MGVGSVRSLVATSTAAIRCAAFISSVAALPYNVKYPSITSKAPVIILKKKVKIIFK